MLVHQRVCPGFLIPLAAMAAMKGPQWQYGCGLHREPLEPEQRVRSGLWCIPIWKVAKPAIYPLVMTNIAIENGHLIVIFHSYVSLPEGNLLHGDSKLFWISLWSTFFLLQLGSSKYQMLIAGIPDYPSLVSHMAIARKSPNEMEILSQETSLNGRFSTTMFDCHRSLGCWCMCHTCFVFL